MITNVKYIKDKEGNNYAVKIVYDNNLKLNVQTFIDNEESRFWKDVEEWVEEGNTIEEAD